jgi:ABC-type glutathione transport system ATPase component
MGSNLPTQPVSLGPLLRVRGLTKHFVRGGLWRQRVSVAAADNVDLELAGGQTLALVGESGSGKSTVARCVAGIERPDSGEIWIGDQNIVAASSGALMALHAQVQMVFQDAITSMNPRFTALQTIEEPLRIQGRRAPSAREAVGRAMTEVGLPANWMERPVMEFSGGQRQRLAIARALVVRPKLLVLDEALTGLDLSTQAQIANLLMDLQASHSFAYLLISHDLALVAHMADTIAVMAHGRIVETGSALQMITAPKHDETIRLAEAARTAQSNLLTITGATA